MLRKREWMLRRQQHHHHHHLKTTVQRRRLFPIIKSKSTTTLLLYISKTVVADFGPNPKQHNQIGLLVAVQTELSLVCFFLLLRNPPGIELEELACCFRLGVNSQEINFKLIFECVAVAVALWQMCAQKSKSNQQILPHTEATTQRRAF